MEEPKYTSTNWMLDEAKKTCTQCLANTDASGVGFDYTEHAIQKIEYGRTCINQVLAQGGQTPQSIIDYIKKLDVQLQEKITEMGATPKGIIHLTIKIKVMKKKIKVKSKNLFIGTKASGKTHYIKNEIIPYRTKFEKQK